MQHRDNSIVNNGTQQKVSFDPKQGVTLTERNTAGPPRAAPSWVTLHMRCVTDDNKRQTTTPDASDHYQTSPLNYDHLLLL